LCLFLQFRLRTLWSSLSGRNQEFQIRSLPKGCAYK
jgi:hypothetical protein